MVARRGTFAFFLAAGFAAVAIGCGGDDDAPSITKADFVAQANAICKKGTKKLLREIVAYQEKNLNEFSVKVVSMAARTVIKPELEGQVEEIRGIGMPGDGEELEQFYSSLLEGVDEIAEERPPTFNEAESMLQESRDIARRYGISACQYTLVDEDFSKRVLGS